MANITPRRCSFVEDLLNLEDDGNVFGRSGFGFASDVIGGMVQSGGLNNLPSVDADRGVGGSQEGDAVDPSDGDGTGARIDDVRQQDNVVCLPEYGPRDNSGNARKSVHRPKGVKNSNIVMPSSTRPMAQSKMGTHPANIYVKKCFS